MSSTDSGQKSKKDSNIMHSVQKRLGEILYLELPQDMGMKSRLGRTLEQYRDKVQMAGLVDDGIETFEDGSR